MRLVEVVALAVYVAGCGGGGAGGGEQCLEVLTDGVQPSATTWVTWAGYDGTSMTPSFVGGRRGQLPAGWHEATCTRPGTEGTFRLVAWLDDGTSSPFDTYCKATVAADLTACSPRPGEPSGEATFFFRGSGLTTVTVTLHPP